MFVANPECVPTEICPKDVYVYLEKMGIPMVSKKGNKYYFSDTEKFRDAIDKMPLLLQAKFFLHKRLRGENE